MTKIEINRSGDVIAIKEFKKNIYDDKMRSCILDDLMDNIIEVKGRDENLNRKLNREEAQNIADTLEY